MTSEPRGNYESERDACARTAEQVPILVHLRIALRVVLRHELVALNDIHLALHNSKWLPAAHHHLLMHRAATSPLRARRALLASRPSSSSRVVVPPASGVPTRPTPPRQADGDSAAAATDTPATRAPPTPASAPPPTCSSGALAAYERAAPTAPRASARARQGDYVLDYGLVWGAAVVGSLDHGRCGVRRGGVVVVVTVVVVVIVVIIVLVLVIFVGWRVAVLCGGRPWRAHLEAGGADGSRGTVVVGVAAAVVDFAWSDDDLPAGHLGELSV